jgi:type II secretory pathway pseudopilin PulG
MTLVEMTLVVCLVVVGLFLLIGWTGNLQQETKRALAVRLLADLDAALARYYHATGCYPTSHGPNSAIQATVDLLDHDRTRPILEALPTSVWRGPTRRNLVDPWGTPLRYYPADSATLCVKANAGRPVFVSAGPDGGFGDFEPAELADNLRSDDPGADGFRLDQLVREPVPDKQEPAGGKGEQHGQEDN